MILNKSGFSMLQVLIAVPLISGLLLIVTQQTSMTNKFQITTGQANETSFYKAKINTILRDRDACELTAGTITVAQGDSTSISAIRDKNGADFLTVGETYMDDKYTLESVTVNRDSSDATTLKINFTKAAGINKNLPEDIPIDVIINANYDASNNVTSCFTDVSNAIEESTEITCESLGGAINASYYRKKEVYFEAADCDTVSNGNCPGGYPVMATIERYNGTTCKGICQKSEAQPTCLFTEGGQSMELSGYIKHMSDPYIAGVWYEVYKTDPDIVFNNANGPGGKWSITFRNTFNLPFDACEIRSSGYWRHGGFVQLYRTENLSQLLHANYLAFNNPSCSYAGYAACKTERSSDAAGDSPHCGSTQYPYWDDGLGRLRWCGWSNFGAEGNSGSNSETTSSIPGGRIAKGTEVSAFSAHSGTPGTERHRYTIEARKCP